MLQEISVSSQHPSYSKVNQIYHFTAPEVSFVHSTNYNDINNLQFAIHHDGSESDRWIMIELSAPVASHNTSGLETWIGISINDDNPDSHKRSARSTTATAGQSTPLFVKSYHQLGNFPSTIIEGKSRVNGGEARLEPWVSLTVTILKKGSIVSINGSNA